MLVTCCFFVVFFFFFLLTYAYCVCSRYPPASWLSLLMASSNTGRKADVLGFRRRASTTKSCNAALSWPFTNGNGVNETGCACNPTLTEEGVLAKIIYQCLWSKHPSDPLFTFNSIILFFSYQKKITDGNDGLILAFRCD